MALVSNLLDTFSSVRTSKSARYNSADFLWVAWVLLSSYSENPKPLLRPLPFVEGEIPDSVYRYAANTPVWIFHDAKDQVVPPIPSVRMAKALEAAGGKVRFTMYEEANHNSWDSAFAERIA